MTYRFSDILFDLDDTLYPHDSGLMAAIRARMAGYVHERLGLAPVAARQLCDELYMRHGLTICGLRDEHGVDPHDYFDFIHAVDYSGYLAHNPALDQRLDRLRARKSIFTNAPRAHAQTVLDLLKLKRHFSRVFDFEFSDWAPKPQLNTYKRVVAALGCRPEQTIMVEDSAWNLPPARALGMTTIWIGSGPPPEAADYTATTLDEALSQIESLLAVASPRA